MRDCDDLLLNKWLALLQKQGDIQTIFDVGANIGQTSKLFRSKLPEAIVYAFEPSASAFDNLKSSMSNDFNVNVFPIALGERDGSVELYENSCDVTNSLLPNAERMFQFAPSEMCMPEKKSTAELMRLDSFCEKESIKKIDLLKVDAQGYERYILEGAGSFFDPKKIRGLMLEILFVDLYEGQTWGGELFEILRLHGYRLFGFISVESNDVQGWKWADALFIADD